MDSPGLFSTDLWPARWHCGYWSDLHGWTYIVSDILIGLAYVAIPLIILRYFLRRKSDLRFGKTYVLFAAFIMLCGTTHFLDAMVFWIPVYRFSALLLAITALVSVATVIHLINILPIAFKLKTSHELEAEILKREEAEKRLSQANDDLNIFAYAASHDLKEPLRKITFLSSLLADLDWTEESEQKRSDLIRKISGSTQRMQRLIDDLLALASIDSNVAMKGVDLNTILRDVLEELELRISEKGALITLAKDLPAVLGEPNYLRQLFINLIGNALKFNHNVPKVEISAALRGTMVEISVSDNGIGMKPELTKSIFEPFSRLHSRGTFEGSGIGLAIVSRILSLHNGSISVNSSEGNGSTFIVSLPVAK